MAICFNNIHQTLFSFLLLLVFLYKLSFNTTKFNQHELDDGDLKENERTLFFFTFIQLAWQSFSFLFLLMKGIQSNLSYKDINQLSIRSLKPLIWSYFYKEIMYKELFSLTVLLASLNCMTIGEETDDIPKLPVYVGLGYDLLQGNPLSNYVDTGFGHNIFKFTYKNGTTTSDNRYSIPDGVDSRVVSSCSFDSTVSIHRGTESYVKSINDKISTKIGMQTSIFEASFSASRNYQVISKITLEDKTSVTQSSAQCQAYLLSMNLFKNFTLEDSFVTAVNVSFHNNDWSEFINEYGTHFVSEVTMGGRAVQQVIYSFEATATLSSLDVDLATASKARFGMFFGDVETDWHKYQEQVKYTEMMNSQSTELYIGGHPPRDGNVMTWVQNVISNPMPIRYKASEITDLFALINYLPIKSNLTKVKQSFVKALDAYCLKLGCKKPVPDYPQPPPVTIEVIQGGAAGTEYWDYFQFWLPGPMVKVSKLNLRAGGALDNIQFLLSDGVKNVYTPAYGGFGGAPVEWYVPSDEFITQMEVWSIYPNLCGMTVITNKGTKSPLFGSIIGGYALITIPDGYRVIGLFGNAGQEVNRLGLMLGRNIYPDRPTSKYEPEVCDSSSESIRTQIKQVDLLQ